MANGNLAFVFYFFFLLRQRKEFRNFYRNLLHNSSCDKYYKLIILLLLFKTYHVTNFVVKVVTTVESFSYFKVEEDKYHYSPTVSPRDSSSLHWSPSIRKTQTRLPNTRIFFSSSHYHSCHWPTISFNTVPNIIIQI